jgi:HPt (histidine-containing phosphotransfer) domain-containing protein
MSPSERARRDAARDAAKEYGKPKVDSADKDTDYKPKKRGRGERDLPHIVSQMRSVMDNDKHPGVKFKDGTTKKVSQKHAAAYLKKHDSSKPADRLKMYSGHDSHKSFMSHVKEAVDEKDKKGLKKLAKGLKGSSAAHMDQMKKLEKMIQDHYIPEASKPNNPKLWAAKKAQAKAKFDVYPSAYANGWAAKQYKKAGGTWRSANEEVVNELSSKTLKNYIRKAASPVNKPSAINLASKGGYKLGKSDKYDLDAGEKEDRKAYNRGRGIQKAAKKLYSRTNESNDSMQRMADTWNDHADHPHPKVQKHIKKAEKAYNDNDHESFYNHTQRAADHAYSLRQKKKTNEEKMAGQEYRTQMAKVKSKNPAIRKAISNIYDKKPGKDIDHPEVKAAKKYMKTEATYDQVLKHRYKSNDSDDSPTHQAYLGKVKKGPTKGMNTYKVIPGANLDSKKGKMAAIKKQLKRRPKQYGIDGKHDPLYPANKGDIQLKAKRQKSKRTAGQYMDQKKGENLAGRVRKDK